MPLSKVGNYRHAYYILYTDRLNIGLGNYDGIIFARKFEDGVLVFHNFKK